jgi:hypothetical protein
VALLYRLTTVKGSGPSTAELLQIALQVEDGEDEEKQQQQRHSRKRQLQ